MVPFLLIITGRWTGFSKGSSRGIRRPSFKIPKLLRDLPTGHRSNIISADVEMTHEGRPFDPAFRIRKAGTDHLQMRFFGGSRVGKNHAAAGADQTC